MLSGPQTIRAWHYIHGSITFQGDTEIRDGADLDLMSKTGVQLMPGFKVLPGGSFKAFVSPDSDGDTILDLAEKRSGCMNPQAADTDGDGLADNLEDANQNGIYEPELNETSACKLDTDGDNIGDKWEIDNGLNPLVADADQHLILTGNLPSGWHYINGIIASKDITTINPGVYLDLVAQIRVKLNPGFRVLPGGRLRAVASPDSDGDRIHDVVERRSDAGCMNPNLEDTDGDGLSDSQEDTNRNGIHEPELNETSPCNADTDGDKMNDKWEIDHGLNPLADDAGLDPDGDGLTNYMEYYFKVSDPHDANSLPPKGTYYEYDELGRIKKIVRIK
ncbi:MAG: hypothetical protein HUN04_12410 [Desulfobacter sp.]|nr:MAG: hypothetical protein HUN04_12410 [Desulfobacter sp.]